MTTSCLLSLNAADQPPKPLNKSRTLIVSASFDEHYTERHIPPCAQYNKFFGKFFGKPLLQDVDHRFSYGPSRLGAHCKPSCRLLLLGGGCRRCGRLLQLAEPACGACVQAAVRSVPHKRVSQASSCNCLFRAFQQPAGLWRHYAGIAFQQPPGVEHRELLVPITGMQLKNIAAWAFDEDCMIRLGGAVWNLAFVEGHGAASGAPVPISFASSSFQFGVRQTLFRYA